MKSRFPISHWPGSPIEPVPPVRRYEQLEVTGTGWLRAQDPSWVELPSEFVLRELLDLDTSDLDAVFAMLTEVGMIERKVHEWALGNELLQFEDAADPLLRTSMMVARTYLKTARALVRHWLAACEGTNLADAWAEEGFQPPDPWLAFTQWLDTGLAAYRVRVELERVEGDDRPPLGAPDADLYSGACLQLANMVAEDLPVRTCANETCGSRFIRQRGGAEHGQYRTEGVLYCRPECARAQANREYRRRHKSKKETR